MERDTNTPSIHYLIFREHDFDNNLGCTFSHCANQEPNIK